MELLAALVGISLALWFCSVLAVAYVLWRYSYTPWKVMRKDIAALSAQVEEIRQLSSIRRAEVMGEEEAAFIEGRLRSRSTARAGQGLG